MKYEGKKLCKVCRNMYHPDNYDMCFDCYAKQPARITNYCKHDSFSSDMGGDYCNICNKKLTREDLAF